MRIVVFAAAAAFLLLAESRCARANVVVVNRDTGGIVWINATNQALDVAAYSLQSPSGGLWPADWLSISGNYDADSGGEVDPDDLWTVLGSSSTDLSEVTTGTTSIGAGAYLDLGTPWAPGHLEDMTFHYLDVGMDEVLPGSVLFVSDVPGDFDGNGFVDQVDLDLVLVNWGRNASPIPSGWFHDFPQGNVDQGELDRVLVNWGVLGRTSPPAGPFALQSVSIPEPSTLLLGLVMVGGSAALLRPRFKRGSARGRRRPS